MLIKEVESLQKFLVEGNKMTILKVFNVNHGDAMLFQPDCVFQDVPLLIDTGAAKYNIYRRISNENFDIMITHSDGDHMNGLDDLLKNKLHNIKNIYLPLYQPEINEIFLRLRGIGKKNAKLIQKSNSLISQYLNKVVFMYDGWHHNRRTNSCNLAKCSCSTILNPPLGNFDFLNNCDEFKNFDFYEALEHIHNEDVFENRSDDFDLKDYTPEKFNDQNEELILYRKEYFRYVIRLIGYTIFKNNWKQQSANELFRLSSNDASIILRYEMQGRFSILFTGDAGDKILKNLIRQGKLGQTDILKVPHHGGADSVGKKILNTIQPKYAILSHNSQTFGRGSVPNQKSIKELQSRPIAVLATNAVTNLSSVLPINQTIGIHQVSTINKLDDIEFI